MKEMDVLRLCMIRCCRGAVRLFRNNVGALQDVKGRLVHYGLCKGSGDLIGWKSVIITPDMVGNKIAIFASLEVKTDSGNVRPEQKAWADTVKEAGGIAGIVRSEDDAAELLGIC